MTRMSRKQILIDADRAATLEQLASAWGVSQSEVIRRAIDDLAHHAERDARRRAAHRELLETFSSAPDLGLTDRQGKRRWDRGSLHGDRGLR